MAPYCNAGPTDKIASSQMVLVVQEQTLASMILVWHLAGNSYRTNNAEVRMVCIVKLSNKDKLLHTAVVMNLSLLIWRVYVCQGMICSCIHKLTNTHKLLYSNEFFWKIVFLLTGSSTMFHCFKLCFPRWSPPQTIYILKINVPIVLTPSPIMRGRR